MHAPYRMFPNLLVPEFSEFSVIPLTDWYSGRTVPARPGVYQRSRVLPDGKRTQPVYAVYAKGVWYQSASDPDEAERMERAGETSIWPIGMDWRGLSEDPTT